MDNQATKGTENDLDGDSRLLLMDPFSLRSAQVHVADEEQELLRVRTEKGGGEDLQLFSKSEYNVVLFLSYFFSNRI